MESEYSKLREKYTHLLDRTWDLFKLGVERERKLEGKLQAVSCDLERMRAMFEKAPAGTMAQDLIPDLDRMIGYTKGD